MSIRYVLILGWWFGITLAFATGAHAQCPTNAVFSLTVDNDMKAWVTWPFGANPPSYPGSDDGYTSGFKGTFGFHRTTPVWPFASPTDRCLQSLWTGGWEMYTPADHSLTVPDLNSRPYAGFLMGSHIRGALDYGFNGNPDSLEQTQSWEIKLGLVGPAARMRQWQWKIHEWFNVPSRPTWAYQINNEFGGYLAYRRSRKIQEWQPLAPYFTNTVDFSLSGGGTLGTFLTEAVAGVTVRWEILGEISDDVLPGDKLYSSRLPSSPPTGSNWFLTVLSHLPPRDVYAFTEVTGRYVLYDITLNGNLLGDTTDTHTVRNEKRVFEYVGVGAGPNILPGLVFKWRIGNFAPTFTLHFVRRSPPYRAQTLAGHRHDEHLTVNPLIADLADQWEYYGSWKLSLF